MLVRFARRSTSLIRAMRAPAVRFSWRKASSAMSGRQTVSRPEKSPARTSMLATRTLSSRLAIWSASGIDSKPTCAGAIGRCSDQTFAQEGEGAVGDALEDEPLELGERTVHVAGTARARRTCGR